MKVAIDTSPLSDSFMAHRVRGTGFYVSNLLDALGRYYSENEYTFFTRGKKIPNLVDLVHYPYFEPFFLTLPLRKAIPTVVTIHDLTPLVFPQNFPPGIKGLLKWEVQKLSLKSVRAVIADSEASKKDIVRFTGISKEKVFVVYLAASGIFSLPAKHEEILSVKKKYNLPEQFVLYVGDVTWNKNLPNLLAAVGKANVNLVMVGKALTDKSFDRSNPWNQDMITVQKLAEGNNKILRLGFVKTEDLVTIYKLATLFAMPSIYEGFGLPILEAMASGTPVVTSKGGSIPEVAGDAAFFVDENDIESIGNGISKVFSTEQLHASLAKKGRNQAKKFSWKKTAEDTVRVYNWVLKGGN